MRFLDKGPDIPSDLLYARDAGDVIFFCGAGVSRARAGGPSFRELATRVVNSLGSARMSPARQLLELSERIMPPPGVGGMPPADRVFALLEQEFAIGDVRAAVAQAVMPKQAPELGPHKSLIHLSTIADGTTRLVTTNFDRVFQLAAPDLAEILPPNLLDPRRPEPWHGIVHLHGMVTPDYLGAASGEFVLSSADFGRAYLADGWATTFMRALMERYHIVFVGYSADDPPIQYLLESLSRTRRPGRLYAFHLGAAEEAAALWRYKGVTAVPFSGFDALWNSLEVWATRAADPDAWRGSVIASAARGPRNLSPLDRAKVAHVVSFTTGARAFAWANPVPPAEWLFVFDPRIRYEQDWQPPGLNRDMDRFKFHQMYKLDGDPAPIEAESRSQWTIPTDAWSGLESNAEDDGTAQARLECSLRGTSATHHVLLPPRLDALSIWIGRIAHNPMTVWWAAGQGDLHPSLVDNIERNVDEHMEPVIRHAWRLILSAPPRSSHTGLRIYKLLHTINAEGWSPWVMRQLEMYERPRIVVERPYTPPQQDNPTEITRLVRADVEYPAHLPELIIPDDWLSRYVRLLRNFLEIAELLEFEACGHFFMSLQPIVPYDDPASRFSHRRDGLASLIINMARHMERLVDIDPKAARCEMLAWPPSSDRAFRLLHVWAAGLPTLMSSDEAGAYFTGLSEEVFWEREVQRDLLVSLSARWRGLELKAREKIESRIFSGPGSWEGADRKQYEQYRAHQVLSRLLWLEQEGLPTKHDLQEVRKPLLGILPDWEDVHGEAEIGHSSSRGGYVTTVTDPTVLLELPVNKVLEVSDEVSGRGRDFLVENRPFLGLADKRPVRALVTLLQAAAKDDVRKREWYNFLNHDTRVKDSSRLKVLIAERLFTIPEKVLLSNLHPISEWMRKCATAVHIYSPPSYHKLWDRMAAAIISNPEDAMSSIVVDTRRDWHMAAINSSAGRITSLLFNELEWEGPNHRKMTNSWKTRAELLLSASGAPRYHVASIFGQSLNWLYYIDQAWTNNNILLGIDNDPCADASEATLTSLLSVGGQLSRQMFLRLRQTLIFLVNKPYKSDQHQYLIPTLLLNGWNSWSDTGERLVSNEEMREILLSIDDGARVALVRRLGQWSEDSGDWSSTVTFVEKVWPRQLVARTQAAASVLAGLAMTAGDAMPQVAHVVVPLLSLASTDWTDPLYLRKPDDNLLERYPTEHLSILYSVLSDDPRYWPHIIAQIIVKLAEIEPTRNDPRLDELRRKMLRP